MAVHSDPVVQGVHDALKEMVEDKTTEEALAASVLVGPGATEGEFHVGSVQLALEPEVHVAVSMD